MARRVQLRRRPARGPRLRHAARNQVDHLVPGPRRPPGRGGGSHREPPGYRIHTFAPYFFAMVALVGLVRIATLVIYSDGISTTVRLGALVVFLGIVFTLLVVGGRWFGRQFALARNLDL